MAIERWEERRKCMREKSEIKQGQMKTDNKEKLRQLLFYNRQESDIWKRQDFGLNSAERWIPVLSDQKKKDGGAPVRHTDNIMDLPCSVTNNHCNCQLTCWFTFRLLINPLASNMSGDVKNSDWFITTWVIFLSFCRSIVLILIMYSAEQRIGCIGIYLWWAQQISVIVFNVDQQVTL